MKYNYIAEQSKTDENLFCVTCISKIKDPYLVAIDLSLKESTKLAEKCNHAEKIWFEIEKEINSCFSEAINIAEISKMSLSNKGALAANLRCLKERIQEIIAKELTL